MPSVVVNSTPLIALSKIGRLDLLRDLYGQICIPEAVWQEVTAKDDIASRRIRASLGWITVLRCEAEPYLLSLMPARLHAGEIECIMLANATRIDYILLDDNAAKKTAKYLGFNVLGTIGVLVAAKRAGLLDSIEPSLRELSGIGFYVSESVLNLARRAADSSYPEKREG